LICNIYYLICFLFKRRGALSILKGGKKTFDILFKTQFQKIYIALLLMTFNSNNLIAQYDYSFPSNWQQAVYYHDNIFNSPPDSPLPIAYIGDTILCGKTYHKIKRMSFFWQVSYSIKLVRIDNGKYFELQETNKCDEVLLFDFTLNEQDTFKPFQLHGNYDTYWIYSDNYIVDSVSFVTLSDSSTRKWMRLKSTEGYGSHKDYLYWVEGIGDVEMGFFPSGDFEGGKTRLICHKEEHKKLWETLVNSFNESCDDMIDLLDSNTKTCVSGDVRMSNENINNSWYFGRNVAVSFNKEPPEALLNSAMFATSGCASISDKFGEILFYTDGNTIWNKNHEPMLNGDNLTGQGFSEQSVIIVPQPGNESVYYVFVVYKSGSLSNFCYSKVNMRLGGGLGGVEYSSKNILILSNVANKIAATYHANCKDVWIVVHGQGNALFYSYRLSDFGIVSAPIVSNIGLLDNNSYLMGQLKISPDGRKLANCIHDRWRVQLFDFNNQTGVVSNPVSIEYRARFYPFSCEFSPNSRKFYVSVYSNLYELISQYDISSFDSLAVKQSEEILWTGSGYLQLAGNGSIYVANPNNNSYLGVINNPDEQGINSSFVENEIYLKGNTTYMSLPNILHPKRCSEMPDYSVEVACVNNNSLYKLVGSACVDSLKWGFGNGQYSEIQKKDTYNYNYNIAGSYLSQMVFWKNGRSDTLQKLIIVPESYIDTQIIHICQGDTFHFGNKLYTTTGNYSDTFQSEFGCDSIVLTRLTVDRDSLFQSIELCQGDTFFQGSNRYYKNGVYTDTFKSSYGCDSLVTTSLVVTTPIVTKNIYIECQGFSVRQDSNVYTSTGIYKDVVNGCDTIITDLTLHPNPSFLFDTLNDNCQEYKGMIAIVDIKGSPPYNYYWSMGSKDSFISGLSKGTYAVSITDSNGCSTSDTVELQDFEINCSAYLFVPNSFSPNGDGLNDVFKASTHNINYFNMRIYNRWGKLIFISNNPELGWDGTYNGTPCQIGVFALLIEYDTTEGINSKKFIHTGTINLIR
jgi:gliding motility-associated-like protein